MTPQDIGKQFSFIDLFAGIGGIRRAFESVGGRCVFSSEWDSYAQKTYEANYGDVPNGDITQVDARCIPHHDILTAGFPCQPFSIAGVSKKNSLGRQHGFLDETRHGPIRPATADLEEEIAQNLRSMRGVDHFGVKLDAVNPPALIGHGGVTAGAGARQSRESRGELRNLVAMAHPDPQPAR